MRDVDWFMVSCLAALLPAQRELLDTLPKDGEACAYAFVGFGPEFSPIELPGEGTLHGLAHLGDVVWCARGDELLRLGWPGGALQLRVEAPAGVLALCADGRFAYALCRGEIHVLDAVAGRAVSSVPLRLVEAPVAIACDGPSLVVVAGGKLVQIDPATGTATELRAAPRGKVQWLGNDGRRLWVGRAEGVRPVTPPGASEPDAWRGQEWPWPLASSAAVWIDGKLLLAGERKLGRAETATLAGLLTPLPALPSERLSLGLYLDAGSTRYEIGPKPLYSLGAVKQELQRIAADPAARIVGNDGKPMPMPVVIEPHRGVTVAAVAAAWDVVKEAGFTSISSPAQEAWVLAERRKATK